METKIIELNNEKYRVNENEFTKMYIEEYCNLNMVNDLRELERLSGLLKELTTMFQKKPSIFTCQTTYGGFLPLECIGLYENVFVLPKDDSQLQNITYHEKSSDIQFVSDKASKLNCPKVDVIYIQEKIDKKICDYILENNKNLIVLSKFSFVLNNVYENRYLLQDSEYFLYIPDSLLSEFKREFSYFISSNNTVEINKTNFKILEYDNLIHYTMIVKNGGKMFEEVLTKNLPYIDKWTILDTGSTDGTQDVIKKVLVGKKKGKLYEEPFINFRESRNRCLDLASEENEPCKFLIMLDDTYVIQGCLREFLSLTRSDQFSSSFSMFIKSDDMEYASNRITKTKNKLRYIYTMHEVIQTEKNVCVCIYFKDANVFDMRCEEMETRTMERKNYDLEQLFLMYENDPSDSRQLYYIAQTYNLLKNFEKALEYFIKRIEHSDQGFIQEKIDALFEAARICNFRLNKDWEICKKYYEMSYSLDKTRPDSLYFIGIHYIIDKNDKNDTIAYDYMKRAYECGYPEGSQHSLKPTLYFHFLLIYLVPLCYIMKNYELGYNASSLYINCGRNVQDNQFEVMVNWRNIFSQFLKPIVALEPLKPYLVMVVDGNWNNWTGKDILSKGLGGSETCMVELARYIEKYKVIIFCRCSLKESFDPKSYGLNGNSVDYLPIEEYHSFVKHNVVDVVIISRFTEYVPFTLSCESVKSVFLIFHDIIKSNTILINHEKMKGILCLSNFHCNQFLSLFPSFSSITRKFNYGIASEKFINKNVIKIPYKFIYSSFPNRGLLPLLLMWPRIRQKFPTATLEIFSDIHGEWVNNVWADGMKKIKDLIQEYTDMGLIYRGWTSKDELVNGWLSSEIWFYPCHFEETFCLTAYEAAASKTLVVTTKLGALPETVASGVLLNLDKTDDILNNSWQDYALDTLFNAMNNDELKFRLIQENYDSVIFSHWFARSKELEKIL